MSRDAARSAGTLASSDAISGAIFGTLSVWGLVAGATSGGRPVPLVAMVIGSLAALVGGRLLAERWPILVLTTVAAAPVIAAVIAGPAALSDDGPLGYENASGALLLLAASAAVLLARTLTDRRWRRVAFAVAVVWMLASWFLGARAAGTMAPLVLLGAVFRGSRRQVRVVLAIGAIVTALGLALAAGLGATYEAGGRAGPVDRAVDATLGEVRVALWHEATQLIRSAPLTGVGPGRFEDFSTVSNGNEASYAHNEYLHMTAELGVPGGILLLAAVVWVIARVWRAPSGPLALPVAIAVAASTLNANIDFVWHFPGVLFPLAVLVGVGVAKPDPFTGSALPFVSERARRVVLATLSVFLLSVIPWQQVNPPLTIANGAAWVGEGTGMHFTGVGGLISGEAPAALYERLRSRQELSVEMIIATVDVGQAGPARLVTMSDGVLERNLTIGQEQDRLVLRLRTTTTDRNATDAEVVMPGVFQAGRTQRLLVVTDRYEVRLYVDGDLHWSGDGPGGRLDNWNQRYDLVVGNEATGDRGWRGVMHFLAIYDVAIEADEVGGLPRDERTQDHAPEPVARYRFDESAGAKVRDRSDLGAGGDLTLPERFPSPPTGYLDTILDAEGVRPSGAFWSAGLFTLWAAAVWSPVRRHGRRPGTVASVVLLGGVALILVASVVRYLGGRAPSIVDVAAAAAGIAVVVVVQSARAR